MIHFRASPHIAHQLEQQENILKKTKLISMCILFVVRETAKREIGEEGDVGGRRSTRVGGARDGV